MGGAVSIIDIGVISGPLRTEAPVVVVAGLVNISCSFSLGSLNESNFVLLVSVALKIAGDTVEGMVNRLLTNVIPASLLAASSCNASKSSETLAPPKPINEVVTE